MRAGDRHRPLDRVDGPLPLAPHLLGEADGEPAEDAREGVADALGDLDALAGVQEGGLRLARHVAQVGRVQMAEADDLEVALLAGDPPAALDQAAGLVELAQDDEDHALEPVAPGVGTERSSPRRRASRRHPTARSRGRTVATASRYAPVQISA